MLESLVSLFFGVNVRAIHIGAANQSIEWQGIYITPIQLGIIFLAIGYVGFLSFLMHRTPLGRKIRALQQYTPAASALGIPVQTLQYLVFGLASISAALAGILIGLETNIQPLMGDSYTIKAFAAMILGGLGNMWGAILGSYLLGIVENLSIGLSFGDWYLPSGYKDAIAFCVVLGVLLVSPGGLMGRKGRRV
jgi:branched-subunit amino acid ABC-type transport system permease component